MTERNRDQRYNRAEELGARAIRRDGSDGASVLEIGYQPGSMPARAWPGDEDFPYVKDPSDLQGPFEYYDGSAPLATALVDYAIGDSIDVAGMRQLVLVLRYSPTVSGGGAVGTLSVLPEGLLDPETPTGQTAAWIPIGVVDPTLNRPAIGGGYAYRNVYSTELRFDPFVGLTPPFANPGPQALTLAFDVSIYRRFRFRFGDVAALATTSTVRGHYYLQR